MFGVMEALSGILLPKDVANGMMKVMESGYNKPVNLEVNGRYNQSYCRNCCKSNAR